VTVGRDDSRRRRLHAAVALAIVAISTAPSHVGAVAGDDTSGRPFAVVVNRVLRGDLVVAANSNLRAAGGWTDSPSAVGDIDGDASVMCVRREGTSRSCADNSSSARLDLPPGSRVVHARLYVETTLSAGAGPLSVRLAAPLGQTLLGDATAGAPRVGEDSLTTSARGALRQSIWDVTALVAANGSGYYTVADIVAERAGPFMPHASWAIVAAYEADPAIDLSTLAPDLRERFASRAVAWHDGFVLVAAGAAAEAVADLAVDPGAAVFAKSVHIVAAARRGSADNLLFNGQPLGNNVTPGDRPPPPWVVVGDDEACNSSTDVFNESICDLGTPVDSKDPGPADLLASSDGTTPSSGSAVDVDVMRIPDRYLVAGPRSAVLAASADHHPVALGMLAISADLGAR
jgi:hypothetical protein